MNEHDIQGFIEQYTRGIDLMNCTYYAIENGFEEPGDYRDSNCRIGFMRKEQCSTTDASGVRQWCVDHHNLFTNEKIDTSAPMGFSFPPPYNFVSRGDIRVVKILGNRAIVEVLTSLVRYEFSIIKTPRKFFGFAITQITGSPVPRTHRTNTSEPRMNQLEEAFPWSAATTLSNLEVASARNERPVPRPR